MAANTLSRPQLVIQPKIDPVAGIPPEAVPIAHAAILHMKGDLSGALHCLTSASTEIDSTHLLKSRGYVQIELKDYASAALSYEAAVAHTPDSFENWFQWGVCLHETGRLEEALAKFEKAGELGADWIEVPLARSVCHLGLKQYTEALELADACLSRNPEYVPALFAKGVVLHLLWRLDKAVDVYRELLRHQPRFIQARMNLVTVGMQQKNTGVIQREAEALLEIDPDNVLGLEGVALVAFSAGEYEKACERYSRLTQLAPNQPEHWLSLGMTLRKLERTSEAVEVFRRALEVRPDSVVGHIYLAETQWKSGDLAGARACYGEAVAKWPEREDLTLSLSHLLEELKEFRAGSRVCEAYCQRNAGKPQVWFRLGYLQWQLHEYDAAVESFTRALVLQPDWPDAEVNLGLVCVAAGELDRAEQVLGGLAERDPSDLEALKGLATIALHRQQNERALELHLRLLDLGEKTPDVYFNCGVLAQHLNRLEEAAAHYREAIAIRHDFAEAMLNLGHTLESLGEAEQAKSFFIPALELNPVFALDYFQRR